MESYKDIVEFDLADLDPSVLRVLSDWTGGREVRNSHNAEYLALHYVAWHLQKLGSLPVLVNKEKKRFSVRVPKLRAFHRRYYRWLKHVKLPRGKYVLITLTLKREESLQDAWCYINARVSRFLERFRDYLRKVKGWKRFDYLGVIEVHKDGYPHVHILARFPFVSVKKIYEWWRDGEKQLSEFQGVDVKFIGAEENARAYVLKYLTKAQNTYWRYEVFEDESGKVKVRVRLSTCFMWYFRVKLFFASRSVKRPKKSSSGWQMAGLVDALKVWRFFYKPLGVSKYQFWSGFIERGGAMFDILFFYSFMPRSWLSRA
jgi:hypothetical protein